MRSMLTLALFTTLAPALNADEAGPSIHGTISKVAPANEHMKKSALVGTFFLDAKPEPKPAYDKIVVRVTEKTKVTKKVGKVEQEATFADLRNGATVTVAIDREVLQTEPPQTNAVRVVIFAPAK
jgi:hypothetical protein